MHVVAERKSRRRFTKSERYDLVRKVVNGKLSVREACARVGIADSTYYNWQRKYTADPARRHQQADRARRAQETHARKRKERVQAADAHPPVSSKAQAVEIKLLKEEIVQLKLYIAEMVVKK